MRNSCWPTLRNMARQLYLLPRERSMTRGKHLNQLLESKVARERPYR